MLYCCCFVSARFYDYPSHTKKIQLNLLEGIELNDAISMQKYIEIIIESSILNNFIILLLI